MSPIHLQIGEKHYQTVEHFFQAMKACIITEHERIRLAKSPGEAKKFGRATQLRPDWEVIKEQVMETGLRAKFHSDGLLAERLLETGSAELIEGNYHNDCEWGVCRGKGKNKLGKLLMKIRGELSQEKSKNLFEELSEE